MSPFIFAIVKVRESARKCCANNSLSTGRLSTGRLLVYSEDMKRYYFASKKNPDLFLYIDCGQESVEGWVFYETKRGLRVYSSKYHEEKYNTVRFEEN